MSEIALSPRRRVARAFRLLLERGRMSTAQLGRALGVSKKIVLADLDVLQSEDLVSTAGEGRDKDWMIDPGAAEGRRTLFDALALRVGAEHCDFLRDTALHSTLERAVRGADGALGPYHDRLSVKLLCIQEPARRYEAHHETVDELLDGLLRERVLTCEYSGRALRLQPLTLVIYRRALYLLARDLDSATVRRLAVERLSNVAAGARFEYPSDWSPRAELGDWFGIYAAGQIGRVVLRFEAIRAEIVRSRVWHHTAELVDLSDGRVELRLHSGGPELVRFVLEWGPICEVVEPDSLKEAVVSQLRGALAKYG